MKFGTWRAFVAVNLYRHNYESEHRLNKGHNQDIKDTEVMGQSPPTTTKNKSLLNFLTTWFFSYFIFIR